ncbi:o-succinylbenzoate synthase [Marivirga sp. S37H4]|uniref:O-succinylbenzoate synthase n=1 Tax=Marivirga aurantiaca TaxID=2802615 RepID=A0A934WWD0_9BACT|nr:o-succinylbenzoate synthase [Marivirga aurantiaca]MBK6264199.1 o-succinylbenzoate synthase [Marivirga aurantiaca]
MKITIAKIKHHQLQFKFEAGTSRGTLKTKDTWFIQVFNNHNLIGIGEAGPLKGLSIDDIEELPHQLEVVTKKLTGMRVPGNLNEVLQLAQDLAHHDFPSIRFALETALLDAMHGGERKIFETAFYSSEKRIPINGLVWMGSEKFMQQQIEEKLNAGFDCIKMKIGAIDFETEIRLLKLIREKYSGEQIVLRVDANGAFSAKEALAKLTTLAKLEIHSIEQPIKPGQWKEMKELCEKSPIPIALDEELIGINSIHEKEMLLKEIQPQYLILKPSLIGGIKSTFEWVSLCKQYQIDWWLTSMLESNIGLNAICQLADYLNVSMPQGLGTGQLYHNNIDSPLTIQKGEIFYNKNLKWKMIYMDSKIKLHKG